jgi:hypothetical protein
VATHFDGDRQIRREAIVGLTFDPARENLVADHVHR